MSWNNVPWEEFLRSLKSDPPQQSRKIKKKEGWERILRLALLPFKLWYALEEPSLRIPYI
jgi:hypothetical protein